ncbi:MAG: hypothetical protein NWQ54_20210 [Paraglaciecola sp.]|uniref:hypothetical protein n=1 Tax=Paraglaciecola sp. TaxID=1920173 RepID=UPI00273E7C12|nr:hypothetical protein [Paraglaciecola sp.]MDP5032347.1 hypothetical protein [Paraglaciecola sp.]MDP5133211.1 hypothetical protein [Paraglaciecola sp.]
MKLIYLVFFLLVLNSCTSKNAKQLMGHALANAAQTEVKYTPGECQTLRQQCVQGDFQEWQTSDKEMGCSCKKL